MAIPGEPSCHEVAPCGTGTWGDIPVAGDTEHEVVTIITEVVVDPKDRAFAEPTKPVGGFYTAEQADALRRDARLLQVREPTQCVPILDRDPQPHMTRSAGIAGGPNARRRRGLTTRTTTLAPAGTPLTDRRGAEPLPQ